MPSADAGIRSGISSSVGRPGGLNLFCLVPGFSRDHDIPLGCLFVVEFTVFPLFALTPWRASNSLQYSAECSRFTVSAERAACRRSMLPATRLPRGAQQDGNR